MNGSPLSQSFGAPPFLTCISEHLFPPALGQYQQYHPELKGGEQPCRRTGRPRRWNPPADKHSVTGRRLDRRIISLPAAGRKCLMQACQNSCWALRLWEAHRGRDPDCLGSVPHAQPLKTKWSLAGDDAVFWILESAITLVGKILLNHCSLMTLHLICLLACWGDKEIPGSVWTPGS